jgi:hypothetical protein
MDVKIIDRGCGTGKTSKMLKSLTDEHKYLVVVPLLSEVERVIEDAAVGFYAPSDEKGTKTDSLAELVELGKNVVTTHALFSRLVELQRHGRLDDYHIIIDEVPDVCHESRLRHTGRKDIDKVYLPEGLITIDPLTARIQPTEKWIEIAKEQNTYEYNFFQQAMTGCLFYFDSSFFIFAMPKELLVGGKSVTIYTFLAQGSMLMAYLKKLGVDYAHDVDESRLKKFKREMSDNLTVKSIQGIDHKRHYKYSFKWQLAAANRPRWKQVAGALKRLYQRQIQPAGVDKSDILITCKKVLWLASGEFGEHSAKPGDFARGTGLLHGVNWTPNTTRGTNDYINCSVAIYLYNQYVNSALIRWLGIENKRTFEDSYALTELIQWLYRTRIRRGEHVTLYMPSERMRDLLLDFMADDDQSINQNLAA